MNKPAPDWKRIVALTTILAGVLALLGHAGFTAAQEGGDKAAPPLPAPGPAGRDAGSPAGEAAPKNGGGRRQPLAPLAAGRGALAPCRATVDEWTTTSASPEPVVECTVHAAGSGQILIIADSWMRYGSDHYEAGFTVASPSMPAGTVERMVDVYGDSGDGADRAVTLSTMWPVASGTHTITLLGWREEGAGAVTADDVTLSALFIPEGSDFEVCRSVQPNLEWSASSSDYSTIATCSLTAPSDGWIYLMGNGMAKGLNSDPYEAQFSLDIDETDGELEMTRWYNYYDDAYDDGTNGAVTIAALRSIQSGNHEINFLGKRWDGVATVYLREPTLAAVFIPAGSARAKTCGVTSHSNWTTAASDLQQVTSCDIDAPDDSWAFIAANGGLGIQNDPYEAQFRLGVDNGGLDWTDRYLNIYADAGDGMDRPVSIATIAPLPAGQHTFHFLGARWGGAGDVLVRYPSLSVVAPGAETFIPMTVKP